MGESKPTHSEACCEYCGRPLAPCVVEFGARRIVAGFRECDCEGARGQRARAERMEAAKREARLAERRKRAGIPKRFLGATVQHQDLIDYLESFEGSAGRGLYIYGSVGEKAIQPQPWRTPSWTPATARCSQRHRRCSRGSRRASRGTGRLIRSFPDTLHATSSSSTTSAKRMPRSGPRT